MTPQRIETPEVVTTDDLRELASATGPCITLAVEVPDPLQLRTRLKNSLRAVEKGLAEAGVDEGTAAILKEPIQTLASSMENNRQWRSDLAVFRSPQTFRHFLLPELAKELVEVGPHFQIRPLLSVVGLEQRFYILALSQKHVRLLRATHHTAEEVALHGIVPENLEKFLHLRMPDHVMDNRSAAGHSTGGMQGVMFGTNTDKEKRNEYLAHFFREIDTGIRRIPGSEDTPLILAGVMAETALYARENTYPRLLEDTIPGSPEKLTAVELHQRAMNIARRSFTPLLSKALSELKEQRGTSRVVTGAEAVLQAACEGRVGSLFVREDAEERGAWDEADLKVKPGDTDLANLAALRTLAYKGHAFALKRSDMPDPASMAALLRF